MMTDLAMRCCQRVRAESSKEAEPAASTDQHQCQPPTWTGLAIATCCHHLCTWDSYIGILWSNEQTIQPILKFHSCCTIVWKSRMNQPVVALCSIGMSVIGGKWTEKWRCSMDVHTYVVVWAFSRERNRVDRRNYLSIYLLGFRFLFFKKKKLWAGGFCLWYECIASFFPDPSFFEARDINSREFSCMAKMSSWAVDNVAMADHNAEPPSDAEGKNEKKTTRMGADGTASDISDNRAESELAAPNVSSAIYTILVYQFQLSTTMATTTNYAFALYSYLLHTYLCANR